MSTSLITRCPNCSTAFRVVAEQLRLRGGRVRCGICHHVFDATAHAVSPGAPRAGAPASAGETAGATSGAGREPIVAAPRAPAREPGGVPTGSVWTRREPTAAPPVPSPDSSRVRYAHLEVEATEANDEPAPAPERRSSVGGRAEPGLGRHTPLPTTAARSEPRFAADEAGRGQTSGAARHEPRFVTQPAGRAAAAPPAEPRLGAAAPLPDDEGDAPAFVAREPARPREPSLGQSRPIPPAAAPHDDARADARLADAQEDDDTDDVLRAASSDAHEAGWGDARWREEDPLLRHPGVDGPEYAAARGAPWPPPLLSRTRRRHSVAIRLFALGLLLALLLLALQAVWWWRKPLATHVPSTRPALEMVCGWFGCEIGYVRAPQRLSIESSSVQPDTSAPTGDTSQRLTLTAVLRNRASHDQPWPSLEVSLTDYSDTVVIRRVLPPSAYLPPAALEQPFAAGSERKIEVALRARGVPISGYRLALFFP
ncbi:DUF3426 domain-containing protein [Verticiella sediminum]|uniref:DUF3426 domain-containing protein n=1 Tax=Verticiella sediminum TaxID=1247510 RepID=A0A556A7U5_9BURK|nr:DUF3426 domain-containing protein [Verticiella sediminum]TSH88950.1 DUF3426 domain-containing protein [Verticiella sediminum]